MRGFVSLCLFLMTCLITLNKESVQGTKRKFAPSYCRTLKFNCQRESHSDHICCKFPLPEGDEVEVPDRPRPLIAIRPFLAGQRPFTPGKKEPEQETEEAVSDGKIVESDGTISPTTTTTTTTTASTLVQSNRRGSSSRNKPNINKSSKPRICQRITINCQENPDHRCCENQNNSEEAPTTTVTTTTTTTTTTQAPTDYSDEYEYKEGSDYESYGDPQQRIPAECFTAKLDCANDPSHPCCAF
ncbi:uncharacterized protein [Lepeophtheirus salmonis]|uniref:uncharacterized protein n=1 Tax=Lepeophtheirus salmonis TaxID=72036 RepID=UPI001AE2C3C5|nr:uncharacterized protein LOC121113837 [Lepeophtheirus salmonis]